MSAPAPGVEFKQAFRLYQPASSARPQTPVFIPTLLDRTSGQHIVLFEDIRALFRHAICVRKGKELVPFELDEKFSRREPLRIIYHPDVVLDVVIDEPGKGKATASRPPVSLHGDSSEDQKPVESQSSTQVTTRVSTMLEEIDSHLETMISNAISKLSFTERIDKQFEHIYSQLDEFNANQRQIIQNQEELKNMVHTALNRLSIIHSRIQALITQTYELHEYPIPRLFIVLPKQVNFRDKVSKPFSNQYRLYFLCECGKHTMKANSRIPHAIHLANHEGYDIDQPTEFFKKYGSYVLTMLQLVKYGFTAAGIIVPALAHFKIVDGINDAQKSLQPLLHDFRSQVENFVKVLEDQRDQNKGPTVEGSTAGERTNLENVQLLQGAELRKLESYLIRHDKGRVLGNLNRIVTLDGHVKWVCNYHRGNYRDKSMQELRDVVRLNNGNLDMKKGKLTVKVSTQTTAQQLYDAMRRARMVQSLDIRLEWNVSKTELKAFADTVCASKISQLDMDGSCFKSPMRGQLLKQYKYNPLLEIMSGGGIQTLHFRQFSHFFKSVKKPSSVTKADQLRVLSIDSHIALQDKVFERVVTPILEKCTSLKDLNLTSDKRFELFRHFEDNIGSFSSLSILTLANMEHAVILKFAESRIKSLTMSVNRLRDLTSDDQDFLKMSNLKRLDLKHAPVDPDEQDELVKILTARTELSEIQIGCHIDQVLTIIDFIEEKRSQLVLMQGSCVLSRLVITDSSNPSSDGISMTISFTDPSNDSKSVSINILRAVNPLESSSPVTEIIRRYGHFIHKLETSSSFNNHVTVLLENPIPDEVFSFRQLRLNAKSLTDVNMDAIHRVVTQSPHLEKLEWHFDELHQDTQLEKLERTLGHHGKKISALVLRGNLGSTWILTIAEKFPTRHNFPKLESFRIICTDKPRLRGNCASWIAAMVSAPPKHAAPLSSSSSSSHATSEPLSTDAQEQSEAWTPLQEIALENVCLEPKDWGVVIMSIGFSALETLSFNDSNFGLEQLKALASHIPGSHNDSEIPLETLHVERTELTKVEKVHILWGHVREFEIKAPLARITGLKEAGIKAQREAALKQQGVKKK